MNRPDDKEKPLTIREILAAFLPPKPEDGERGEDGERDREPLTIREYIGAMPNLSEVIKMAGDAAKATGRGVQRIWRNIVRKY